MIDRSAYVNEGQYNLGPIAALKHIQASGNLLREGRTAEALADAELARNLDPASATVRNAVGDAQEASGRSADARAAWKNALQAPELDPVFQERLVAALEKKLNP